MSKYYKKIFIFIFLFNIFNLIKSDEISNRLKSKNLVKKSLLNLPKNYRIYHVDPYEWKKVISQQEQDQKIPTNNFNSQLIKSKFDNFEDFEGYEPYKQNDFELISFWPNFNKRDTDYGHLRFGRSSELSQKFLKKSLDKKVEPDYGHFRFG